MTRHSILFSFLGVLAVAAFNGCGDDAKTEEPDKYPGLTQFCNAIAQVQCTQQVVDRCSLTDITQCQAPVQQDCNDSKSDLTKNFDTTRYNAKKAEPCIAKIKESFADAVLDQTELANIETACAPTFSLNAAEGFQCKRDADCSGADLKCFFDAAGVGACQKVVNVTGGSNCAGSPGALCPDTQYCFSSVDAGRICKDKEPTGGTCAVGTRLCAAGNFCKLDADDKGAQLTTGICTAQFAPGTDCTQDEQCSASKCSTVYTATGPKGKCVKEIVFSAGESYCDNFRP